EASETGFARFWRAKTAMAATEFALILPVMTLLFFGMLEGADALSVKRKISHAANTLTDLAAQSTEISPAEIDDLFTGVERILEPNDTSSLTYNLVSVIRDPDSGEPVVHWSRDNAGVEPYTRGGPFTNLEDASLLNAQTSLIVVEMSYQYNSRLTHHVFGAPISFSETVKRWPRRSTRVQLCDPSPTNCTT
ncbi:MAG: TadE/TadG family type IV pilus assembly protein, partial [Parvularculaceae bacterium]